MTKRSESRREFLKHGSRAAIGLTILQSGSARTYAANEKLNLAAIGAGGRAAGDIEELSSENFVALCDVDANRAGAMFRRYSKARRFEDYRIMLEEMDAEIDAVLVATPDHHHFHASMTAIRHGKPVYCEKPLTHSVEEARALTHAARKAGVATQMGNQKQAHEDTRVVQEFVMDGAIGQVREAHLWTDRPSRGLFGEYWPQGVARPRDTPAQPGSLNWDLWVGPAQERPYHPAYLPSKWRGWWDFGTGALGDIGCHYFDPVFRALKLGAPESVEASSSRVNSETFPLSAMITYEFPARGKMAPVRFVWYDGGLRPARPSDVPDGVKMGTNGMMLIGDDGILLSDWDNGWHLYPEKRARDYGAPPRSLPRSQGHHREWIDACKGGPMPGSNFDVAGPMTEAVLLGNVVLRPELREDLTTVRLKWDSANMRFTNHEEANRFLGRSYRQGWTL